MRFTNKHNLPEAFVNAVSNDGYSRGKSDITVTELIGPPLQRILRREHDEDLEEDVSDRMFALMGQGGHTILERAAKNELTETRLYATIRGWVVGGQLDNLHMANGVLSDYKFTSVYSLLYGNKPEWVAQLNCLAQLVVENGWDVRGLQIVVLARDWQKSKAKFDPAYPKSAVQVVKIPLWLESERVLYMDKRVAEHQHAELCFANGDPIPECTNDERWEKAPKYALMKEGGKRAVKLFDSEAEALASILPRHYVEHRPGARTRCEEYCVLSKCGVCPYFKINEVNDEGV